MAAHGPAHSIPGAAEPGWAEREGSPLREVPMESFQSSIRPEYAAAALVSGNLRTAAWAGPTIAWQLPEIDKISLRPSSIHMIHIICSWPSTTWAWSLRAWTGDGT